MKAEETIKGFIARDPDERLFLFLNEEPKRRELSDTWDIGGFTYTEIDRTLFPDVSCENTEPTEVEIKISVK